VEGHPLDNIGPPMALVFRRDRFLKIGVRDLESLLSSQFDAGPLRSL
jgi:hypothetical protein